MKIQHFNICLLMQHIAMAVFLFSHSKKVGDNRFRSNSVEFGKFLLHNGIIRIKKMK